MDPSWVHRGSIGVVRHCSTAGYIHITKDSWFGSCYTADTMVIIIQLYIIDFSFTLLLMVSTLERFFVLHHVEMVTTSGRQGINMLVRCVVGFKLDI